MVMTVCDGHDSQTYRYVDIKEKKYNNHSKYGCRIREKNTE